MDTQQVIDILKDIALLMELKGENSFKIRAYNSAARALKSESRPIAELVEQNKLTEIKGIGKGIAETISEMVEMGQSLLLTQLSQDVPSGVVKMLKIQGLGVKKVKMLHEQLGISSLQELQSACESGKVAELSGFSDKTAQNILSSIASLMTYEGLFLYVQAEAEAEKIVQLLQNDVENIKIVGGLRRKCELVDSIVFVAVANDPNAVGEILRGSNVVKEVTIVEPRQIQAVLNAGIPLRIHFVTKAQLSKILLQYTGTKEFCEALSQAGINLDAQEYEDESAIFKAAAIPYIVPELRETAKSLEIAQQNKLPKLVEFSDLKGILHMHTTYSDGQSSVREMALAAKERGFDYIGISDHSQSLTVANGLKPKDVLKQLKEIDEVNQELHPFRIFKSIESDILPDGSLDYEPEILAQFDFIIASIHSHFRMTEAQMTQRIIKAVENPYTTILGHPTGRLLLQRAPYKVDMHAVIDAAVAHNTAIEINAHPLRLDLDWRLGEYAQSKGLKTCINPDAHSISGLDLMIYGLHVARKAWFSAENVLNTYSTEEFSRYLEKI